MFVTNAHQVRDYRLCKYLYNSRHNLKKPERSLPVRDLMAERFDEAMKKLVKRAYFHTMGGTGFPTMDRLLYEWDRIWHEGRTYESILTDRNHPDKSLDSYNADAINMIRAFHARTVKNPGKVVGSFLGEDYFVQLDNGVVITGELELVLERSGQIVIPHFTTKNPANFKPRTLGQTKIILDAMAFRSKTGRVENFSVIEYLPKGKVEQVVLDDVIIHEASELMGEMATRDKWPAEDCYWCDRCSFSRDCPRW